ncbi:hypothetical protein HO133_003919 [Letharia lupina]|uniref:Uncharacterized protein n=1 Tax=Letharia lupina TaxID=560253 RepID=A0A8H6F998_9LECA|nr:uncharacterized protein HO133_003919 [Letharia lupina]KAF6219453.1 hypothetical protein HO133_003919 [Letharia lupina]
MATRPFCIRLLHVALYDRGVQDANATLPTLHDTTDPITSGTTPHNLNTGFAKTDKDLWRFESKSIPQTGPSLLLVRITIIEVVTKVSYSIFGGWGTLVR